MMLTGQAASPTTIGTIAGWVADVCGWIEAGLIADDITGIGVADDPLLVPVGIIHAIASLIEWMDSSPPVVLKKHNSDDTKDDSDEAHANNATNNNASSSNNESKEKEYKTPKRNQSGKEGAKDAPDWAKGNKPYKDENGDKFARRLLDEKYGRGNYSTKSNTEFSKIKKWGDRSFE